MSEEARIQELQALIDYERNRIEIAQCKIKKLEALKDQQDSKTSEERLKKLVEEKLNREKREKEEADKRRKDYETEVNCMEVRKNQNYDTNLPIAKKIWERLETFRKSSIASDLFKINRDYGIPIFKHEAETCYEYSFNSWGATLFVEENGTVVLRRWMRRGSWKLKEFNSPENMAHECCRVYLSALLSHLESDQVYSTIEGLL